MWSWTKDVSVPATAIDGQEQGAAAVAARSPRPGPSARLGAKVMGKSSPGPACGRRMPCGPRSPSAVALFA